MYGDLEVFDILAETPGLNNLGYRLPPPQRSRTGSGRLTETVNDQEHKMPKTFPQS
jgi:hypothetical protein